MIMEQIPAYQLDIEGLEEKDSLRERLAQPSGRPWVGILFECCAVYSRVYRNMNARAYRGVCPRCGMSVTLRVGPEGTNSRFFSAG